MIANSLRPGTLVKLNPMSYYAKLSYQLPVNKVGIIEDYVEGDRNCYKVSWIDENKEKFRNSYTRGDLIVTGFSEYLKRL